MDNKKKVNKAEEGFSYRVMIIMALSVVLMVWFSRLRNIMDFGSTSMTGRNIALFSGIATAICTICAFVWYIISVKRKRFSKERVLNGLFVSYLFSMYSVSAFILYYNYIIGLRAVYLLLLSAAIIYLLQGIYSRTTITFTISHLIVAACMFALYKSGGYTDKMAIISLVIGIAACAIVIILALSTQKSGGIIRLFGVDFKVLGQFDKRNVLIIYAITLVIFALAFFLGGTVAFAAMLLTVGWVIFSLIRSTVELMR